MNTALNFVLLLLLALPACGSVSETKVKSQQSSSKVSHRLEARTLTPPPSGPEGTYYLESDHFTVTNEEGNPKDAWLRFNFQFHTLPAIDQVVLTLFLTNGDVNGPSVQTFPVVRIGSNELEITGVGVFSGAWVGEQVEFSFQSSGGFYLGKYLVSKMKACGVGFKP